VKFLVVGLGVLVISVLVMPLLLVAVLATHPWLAAGALTSEVQVVVPTPKPDPAAPAKVSDPGPLGDVLEAARSWLGVPYLFGGCSHHGVDCSCLVQLVYRAVGINLPRVAADQFAATTRLTRDQLVAGDLVFFANTYMPGISHVGIYLGGGLQINAPTEGQVVSVQPVFDGYWGQHYAGAGRARRGWG
jgi:cell wall-associated NlpC family hydrolase